MKLKKLFILLTSIFIFSNLTSCNKEVPGDKTPTSLTIKGIETLPVGLKVKFEVKILPIDSCLDVVWSSKDEKVATVDQKGNVTGISGGKTSIIATSKKNSSKFASFDVDFYESHKEEDFIKKYKEFSDNFFKNPLENVEGKAENGDYAFINGSVEEYPNFVMNNIYLPKKNERRIEFLAGSYGEFDEVVRPDELKERWALEDELDKEVGITNFKNFYYVSDDYISIFKYRSTASESISYFTYYGYDKCLYLLRNVEALNGYITTNVHLTPVIK